MLLNDEFIRSYVISNLEKEKKKHVLCIIEQYKSFGIENFMPDYDTLLMNTESDPEITVTCSMKTGSITYDIDYYFYTRNTNNYM